MKIKTETNGYPFHGYSDGLFYYHGYLANGFVDVRSEYELALSTPLISNPPNYFINGVLSYRESYNEHEYILYKVNGDLEIPYTGRFNDNVYNNGKLLTGEWDSEIYYNGKLIKIKDKNIMDNYNREIHDQEFLDKYFPKKKSLYTRIKNKFKK